MSENGDAESSLSGAFFRCPVLTALTVFSSYAPGHIEKPSPPRQNLSSSPFRMRPPRNPDFLRRHLQRISRRALLTALFHSFPGDRNGRLYHNSREQPSFQYFSSASRFRPVPLEVGGMFLLLRDIRIMKTAGFSICVL